ncbi:MAG: hypothetical protein LCH53_12735 [Bacteroidetes bacterium]|nr:hypothetical protein [Bacteroidota bacterium]
MPRPTPRRRVAAPRPVVPKPLPSRAWRQTKRLLAESVTIVLSVLIALAVNTWWQGRTDRMRVRQALTAIRDEITANRAALAENRRLNEGIVSGWDSLLARSPSAALPLDRLPRPPELVNEAYATAQTTGVFALMNYRVASEIGRTYNRQDLTTLLTDRMMERFSDPAGIKLRLARDEASRMFNMQLRVDSLYMLTSRTLTDRLNRMGGPASADD